MVPRVITFSTISVPAVTVGLGVSLGAVVSLCLLAIILALWWCTRKKQSKPPRDYREVAPSSGLTARVFLLQARRELEIRDDCCPAKMMSKYNTEYIGH